MPEYYIIIALCSLTLIASTIALVLGLRKKRAGGDELLVEYLHELSKQLEVTKAEVNATTRAAVNAFNDTISTQFAALTANVNNLVREEKLSAERQNQAINAFTASLKADIERRLDEMNQTSSKKIEEIRKTVDEKLTQSLENKVRLAFENINTSLVEMQKGFVEVEKLSGQVTRLNGVFSSVKNRGTWGELSLESILTEMFPAELYEKQFHVGTGREAVDFAIKMPAGGEDLYLPIDAKFPLTDYEKLSEAYAGQGVESADNVRKRLLFSIKEQAKSISQKYIAPPLTTDFAIMFLPSEGLFAEVAREAGFIEELRSRYKIIPCGPTTFSALANSLLVGFTTLKIQKKSADVVRAMKEFTKDFDKFTDGIDKIRKNSLGITNALEGLDKRSSIIKKKLSKLDLAYVDEPSLIADVTDEAAIAEEEFEEF